eukprot:TRINITY_DN1166_c0_g1_i1.p1 TRINITY_DN1166_c0_g1~~TRINITY_DN1166_c0_g1_i1.p1  ORF type:complete len:394 (+),score=105.49 TRINITY_DN1166_c0_g1_i1:128-1183(+)
MGNCCICPSEQTIAVIESFGKFSHFAGAGCHCINCCTQSVAGTLDLRILSMNLAIETKTKNNVFVTVQTTIQYSVTPHNAQMNLDPDSEDEPDDKKKKGKGKSESTDAEELIQIRKPTLQGPPIQVPKSLSGQSEERYYLAYYSTSQLAVQVKALIEDSMRTTVAHFELDELFEIKDKIAYNLKKIVNVQMKQFGYVVHQVLLTDIDPVADVKNAMNAINAAQRRLKAAEAEAEAEKLKRVKQAEAEAAATHLAGKGIADARREIVHGLQDSVAAFQQEIAGMKSQEILMMVLATQYLDAMKEVATHSRTNTILMPSSPGAATDIFSSMRQSFTEAMLTVQSQSGGSSSSN